MIGIVLTGGASRRMGRPKSKVEIGGIPMAAYVVSALSAVCDDVLAAGGDAAGLEVVPDPDRFARHGPVVGVTSALEHLGRPILAVAVDQPWVRAETLAQLAARYDGRPVLPLDDGTRQVTCAVYAPSFLAAALAAREGGSIQAALDEAAHDLVDDWPSWGEDGRSWFSIDSEQDVGVGVSRFGMPGLARG